MKHLENVLPPMFVILMNFDSLDRLLELTQSDCSLNNFWISNNVYPISAAVSLEHGHADLPAACSHGHCRWIASRAHWQEGLHSFLMFVWNFLIVFVFLKKNCIFASSYLFQREFIAVILKAQGKLAGELLMSGIPGLPTIYRIFRLFWCKYFSRIKWKIWKKKSFLALMIQCYSL